MPASGAMARLPGSAWTIRAGMALAAAISGYVSVTDTLGFSIRSADLSQAHALAPHDGRVTALFARDLAARADATPADRMQADRLAMRALRQEPLNPVAVTTLGLSAEMRNDRRRSENLLSYAQLLSRRDLQTQLWAIERAVDSNNIAGALEHYDIALRTYPQASDLLFPVLASAIANPVVSASVVRTLSQRPVWWGTFLDYMASNGPNPQAAAGLMLALRRTGTPIPPSADATIISLLRQRIGVNAAWRYYTGGHSGANEQQSRHPDFTTNPVPPSFFDWTAVNDGNVAVDIRPKAVEFSVPAGISGLLLQQVEVLSPGSYRLDGISAYVDQSAQARPYWVLSCADGRELGRVSLPSSEAGSGHFGGVFVVPASCPIQTLALFARSSDAVTGVSGRITYVKLQPRR